MGEVERLCDRVIMLKTGRIEDDDTPAKLIARYGRRNLEEVFLDIARGRGEARRGRAMSTLAPARVQRSRCGGRRDGAAPLVSVMQLVVAARVRPDVLARRCRC